MSRRVKMVNEFVVSDTHFSHKNIIKYCDRPFKDIDEMNNFMIEQWNSVVSKDDIVYHLGDFTWDNNRERFGELVSSLNGRIRLLKGNHDRLKPYAYLNLGFDKVYEDPFVLDGYIIMSHEQMFTSYESLFINIFGHSHNAPEVLTLSPLGACVCVERTGYKPVLLSDVVDSIVKADVNAKWISQK